MTAERFYEPVKVGSFTDIPDPTDLEDDDAWEQAGRDVYAVRPRDRSGLTIGSELKLCSERADLLCDILEGVRQSAIAAATQRAKTLKAVECEASQSGGTAASPDLHGGIA